MTDEPRTDAVQSETSDNGETGDGSTTEVSASSETTHRRGTVWPVIILLALAGFGWWAFSGDDTPEPKTASIVEDSSCMSGWRDSDTGKCFVSNVGPQTAQPGLNPPPPNGGTKIPVPSKRGGVQVAVPTAPEKTYKVTKADHLGLIKIAEKLKVPWEAMYAANEAMLKRVNAKRCAALSKRYTQGRRPSGRKRTGHFCNFSLKGEHGQLMVWANSLFPGDVLKVPSSTAPAQVRKAIGRVLGDKIVIVIDDTGSMSDNRAQVSTWYMAAVASAGKRILKVILYADGHITEYEAGGARFYTRGGHENTRGALEYAARKYRPDAIVLISDEPGDDWNGFRNLRLPPVIAHSLDPSADWALGKVAAMTGGRLLRSHSIAARVQPIANYAPSQPTF